MSASAMAVYVVTEKGARLGVRLAERLGADLFVPDRLAGSFAATGYASLGRLVAETFGRYRSHVFVAACGIAVRVIAPHLVGKAVDPAVVCLDDAGRFAVSLLAGHLGGANDLALAVAQAVGATPVVTTATDAAGAPAVEVLARDMGLAVENPEAVRRVNAALAAGGPVAVFDPLGLFAVADPAKARFFEWVPDPSQPNQPQGGAPLVVVDWRLGPDRPDRLYLRPKVLAAGVGCRKGAPAEDILALLAEACRESGLALGSIGVLASIEAKRQEPGLVRAAAALDASLAFFSAQQLATVPAPHPSATVAKHMGVGSVCEAAAILAAGGGRLLVPKTKAKLCTVAVALAA